MLSDSLFLPGHSFIEVWYIGVTILSSTPLYWGHHFIEVAILSYDFMGPCGATGPSLDQIHSAESGTSKYGRLSAKRIQTLNYDLKKISIRLKLDRVSTCRTWPSKLGRDSAQLLYMEGHYSIRVTISSSNYIIVVIISLGKLFYGAHHFIRINFLSE